MPVKFEVNGEPVEVEVEPRLTLADCLRHHLRLTGTHVGCEHGVCGACTVLVDGAAVRSCLLLAVQAEGAKVVTVEGLSLDEGLTPLQASFRKHTRLQCGFWHAGMITTAPRAPERGADCDADRVREVLSGNLCRCTGYISIVEACWTRARPTSATDTAHEDGQCVRRPADRTAGRLPLRARPRRICSTISPGLACCTRRSCAAPWGHGRIRAIDVASAKKVGGVHRVITAADLGDPVPRVPMRLQPMPEFEAFGQPVMARDKVRYVGEALAMVLADSAGIAEDALAAIDVDIEPLPAGRQLAGRGCEHDAAVRGQGQQSHHDISRRAGRRGGGIPDAPYTRRERFSTQRHTALPMEPRGVIAEWDAALGRLTVWGAAKVLFANRRILARQMGLTDTPSTWSSRTSAAVSAPAANSIRRIS